MARKNKTLPKDFKEIVKRGNLDELKAVFDKCDINAYKRYGYETALFFEGLTADFVKWAVEQGADVNFRKERTSPTPLCEQVRYKSNASLLEVLDREDYVPELTKDNDEIIELLISLGAEVEPNSYRTPLDDAGWAINPNAIRILLKQGVNPIGRSGTTSLQNVLNNLALIPDTLECAEILLDAGVPVNECMQEFVRVMGKRYQSDPEYFRHIKTSEQILNRLYELFDVEPVQPIIRHDGVAPITITEDDLEKAYQKLWDYLVPSTGKAKTMQGEAIRITGRVAHEIGGNGGMNWKDDFKEMLDTLMTILASENSLSDTDLMEVKRLINIVYHGNSSKYNEADELCNYAVLWVKKNSKPIKFTMNVNYQI